MVSCRTCRAGKLVASRQLSNLRLSGSSTTFRQHLSNQVGASWHACAVRSPANVALPYLPVDALAWDVQLAIGAVVLFRELHAQLGVKVLRPGRKEMIFPNVSTGESAQ